MAQTASGFEVIVSQHHHMSPIHTAAAEACYRREHWERMATKLIDEGYVESAEEFVRFVEACLRFIGFQQFASDRAYAIGARNLCDAIARRWTSRNSTKRSPTANEIAGLVQSEWVASGQFRTLRPGVNKSDA